MDHSHGDHRNGPETIPAEQQLINKTQLARALGVTARTIDNWVRLKLIPSMPISARCRRFRLGAVLAALGRYETAVVEPGQPEGAKPCANAGK
jgi:hypothetical protein